MEDILAFTIRVPRRLVDQIDHRAAVNHRKRNGQINIMLEAAIDASVQSDLEVIHRTRDLSQSE